MQYDTTQDDRLWGTLAYVLGIFFHIVAPLIIFMIKKNQSRFVAYHALQSLMLGVTATIGEIVVGIGAVILMAVGLKLLAVLLLLAMFGVMLGTFSLQVVGAIKANSGQFWVAPLVGAFVQQQTLL